jgi:hypothetical protein
LVEFALVFAPIDFRPRSPVVEPSIAQLFR